MTFYILQCDFISYFKLSQLPFWFLWLRRKQVSMTLQKIAKYYKNYITKMHLSVNPFAIIIFRHSSTRMSRRQLLYHPTLSTNQRQRYRNTHKLWRIRAANQVHAHSAYKDTECNYQSKFCGQLNYFLKKIYTFIQQGHGKFEKTCEEEDFYFFWNSYSSKNPEKNAAKILSRTAVFNIDNNKKWFLNSKLAYENDFWKTMWCWRLE